MKTTIRGMLQALVAALVGAAATTVRSADVCAEGIEIGVFALEGDQAPGTGAGFQTFDRPNISEAGAIAFTGDTDGPAGEDDVLYVDLMLVAREGDAAPGVEGGFYASFGTFESAHQVNAAGDVVFVASLRGPPAGADTAVYRNATLVALMGDPAPGIAGRVYQDFSFAGIADDGMVGFLADLDGSRSDDSIIYFGDAVLYRQGDPVPGLKGETWDADFDEIQWNGRGEVLFVGNTSLPSAMDKVLMRRRIDADGGVVEEIVAQEDQPIAARDGEDFLDAFQQTAFSENGGWGLRGTLAMAATDANTFVLTETGFFAQEGDPVAELPGAVLGNFAGMDVNALGDTLYLADLEGDLPPGIDEGIFLNGCLLVTDGTQVPGLPDGTLFSDLGFEDLYLNDGRRIVFAASYSGAISGDGLFTISLPVPCRADVDGTGTVDIGDLIRVLRAWGACPGKGECPEDIDGNGQVDVDDLLAVLEAWGPCS